MALTMLDLAALGSALRTKVLIDGPHVFGAADARAAEVAYRGVGQG